MREFKLDKSQEDKAINFVYVHKCTLKSVGAIGGNITYHFTPTNVGTVVKISCACGKEEDLTDYSEW